MSLKARLQGSFGGGHILQACRALVESVFPEYSHSVKSRDVFALAERVGVHVELKASEHYDGKFQTNRHGISTVTLSTLAGKVRMRFTLAHELSHWLLRHGKITNTAFAFRGVSPEAEADAEEEEVANLLAAELLMPIRVVQDQLQRSSLSISFVTDVSKRFNVSFKAAFRRVADVSAQALLYMNVVPNRFRDLSTTAEVDEALYAWPIGNLRQDRKGTRLIREYRFSDIQASKRTRLGLIGAAGKVLSVFDVRRNTRPFPNCDLFTVLSPDVVRAVIATKAI